MVDCYKVAISKLAPLLAAKPEICFAYIFGSVAKGTAGKLSDIDIAIFVDPLHKMPMTGYGYKSELSVELKSVLAREVDLVLLNDASTVLKYQVLKNGVLAYCRSDVERRDFHENTVKKYLDFKPLLKVQSDYLHKRLVAGTFGGEGGG